MSGMIFKVPPTNYEIDHVGAYIAGENYAKTHEGLLPNNYYWRDIEFRYKRSTEDFSIVHPNFKLLLDQLAAYRPTHESICPPPYDHKAPYIPSIECRPDVPLHPLVVPEPGSMVSLAIGLVLLMAFGVKRSQ